MRNGKETGRGQGDGNGRQFETLSIISSSGLWHMTSCHVTLIFSNVSGVAKFSLKRPTVTDMAILTMKLEGLSLCSLLKTSAKGAACL
jgi:hypothetical protein